MHLVRTSSNLSATHNKHIMLERLDRRLFQLVSWAAQLLLWAAVASGFYQVLSRFVLQSPAAWSEALTRATVIWTVMLGISLAFRHGAMLGVDILHSTLKKYGYARLLEHVVLLIVVGFLLFLVWIGFTMTWRVRFQTMPTLGISIAWVYLSIPIGAMLSSVAVLLRWATSPLKKR